MQIWVDADACPAVVKETLFRASKRTGVQLTLVANQALTVPTSPHIRAVQVPRGFEKRRNGCVRSADDGTELPVG